MGELKDKAKGLGNQIAGKAKAIAGDATDDISLQVKGKMQQAKGKAQRLAGDVKGAAGDKI